MKVLKDPDQVLQILDQKLDKVRKKFKKAEDEFEEAEIFGEGASIIRIAFHIRRTIADYGYFEEFDMEDVSDYAADAKRIAHAYSNPQTSWYMKGCAKGAVWACKKVEEGMKEE